MRSNCLASGDLLTFSKYLIKYLTMPPIPHRRNWTTIVLLLIIVILLLILGIVCYRCRKCTQHCPCKTDTIAWGSRNILFKAGTLMPTKAGVIAQIEDSLNKELVGSGIDTSLVHLIVRPWFCPCDSNLINVDLTLINASGNPVTPPPPVQPPSGSLGGSVFASTLNVNLATPEYYSGRHLIDSITSPDSEEQKTFFKIDSGYVLAILDTGLDTAKINKYLPGALGNFNLWSAAPGKLTLYNTLPYAQPLPGHELWYDDDSTKHGSTVTYIAAEAGHAFSPKVMVLKVLDSLGRGTIFSVSCGMSYALQNNVNLINASLGYSGPEDPILRSYFEKAEQLKIPVIVAAGNDTTSDHKPDSVCTTVVNHRDSLTAAHPFYPAFFAEHMKYVVSVTGMSSDSLPCYYQRFSNRYSDFAAWISPLNKATCCSFYAPYLLGGRYVEGSSFSAPVITGELAFYLLNGQLNLNGAGPTTEPKTFLMSHSNPAPSLSKYVRSGQFVPFTYSNYLPNKKRPT